MSTTGTGVADGESCRVRVVHQDRVAQARRSQVPAPALEGLSRIFKALGDPSRLKMMIALRETEMCVCDLAAFTGLSESAVSHQLRRLKDLALVRNRREGQIVYYCLDDHHVETLLEVSLAHISE